MGLGESYIERYLSKEHAYGNTCSGFSNNYVWTAVYTVKGTRKKFQIYQIFSIVSSLSYNSISHQMWAGEVLALVFNHS